MHEIISRSEAKELGLKSYFTGKLCKHGHISFRHTRNGECKECQNKRYEDNKEYFIEKANKWKKENPDAAKKSARERGRIKYYRDVESSRQKRMEYYFKNHEDEKKSHRDWVRRNLAKINAYNKRKRKRIEVATPSWANIIEIEKIYLSCPEGMQVDHIIPISSKYVCGLHCESNLRHLDAFENQSKGNRYWPDMP